MVSSNGHEPTASSSGPRWPTATDAERRDWRRDLASQLGARYAPSRVSLDSYELRHPGQEETLARVRRLAEELPQACNVVIYGTPGTGKDFLLASLLYAATDAGLRCEWHRGADLFAAFRRHQRRSEEGLSPRSLFHVPVLAVSDPILPGADPEPWLLNDFFAVVDHRYRNGRPVWVTANADSEDELASKLTWQIWDRLRDGAVILPCFWPSHRGNF